MEVIEMEFSQEEKKIIQAYDNMGMLDKYELETDFPEVFEFAQLMIHKIDEARKTEFQS